MSVTFQKSPLTSQDQDVHSLAGGDLGSGVRPHRSSCRRGRTVPRHGRPVALSMLVFVGRPKPPGKTGMLP